MAVLFASGHAVDLVLLIMAAEFAWLTLRRTRSRAGAVDRAMAFLPGAFILLALRGALVSAPWPWIAGPLALSFPFHIADVARRRL